MKNYFYPLDENGNVTQNGCYEVPESGDISFFIKHHPVGTQHIISDFYIESCKDSYGNYLWRVVDGQIVENARPGLLAQVLAKKLGELQGNYQASISALPYSEQKAKTLALEAMLASESPPAYWTNWKAGRDALDVVYTTKKSALLAITDIAQAEEMDVSVA